MAIKQELERKEKRTCLYDKHISLGATMVTFGGFDMPLLYQNAGIAPEHMAVREHVGLFDVSHMGEVTVKGKDAERYVQHIFTNDIAGAPVGKIYYGMMCYENGGTVDDLLVYKLGENDFLTGHGCRSMLPALTSTCRIAVIFTDKLPYRDQSQRIS